jgi:hypothetical protein
MGYVGVKRDKMELEDDGKEAVKEGGMCGRRDERYDVGMRGNGREEKESESIEVEDEGDHWLIG